MYEDTLKQLPQEDIGRMLELLVSIQNMKALPNLVFPEELVLEPPIAQLTLVFSSGDSQLFEFGKVDKEIAKFNVSMNSGQSFQADFQTIYGILRTYYHKVLTIVLNGVNQTKIPLLTP